MSTVALPGNRRLRRLEPRDVGHDGRVVLQRAVERAGRDAACWASSVASFTFSTSSPVPLAPVEYESIATRAGMPKAMAESALWMAMSASCSAVGFGLTAQSPNTSTWSGRHMKKMLETRLQPGTVLMICSAGRIVCAVRVDRARDEPVGLVERQHHRADHDRVLQLAPRELGRHALRLAPLDEGVHVARAPPRRCRAISTVGGSVTPCLRGDVADLVGVAEQHAARDPALLRRSRRPPPCAARRPRAARSACSSARAASTRRWRNAGGERRGDARRLATSRDATPRRSGPRRSSSSARRARRRRRGSRGSSPATLRRGAVARVLDREQRQARASRALLAEREHARGRAAARP